MPACEYLRVKDLLPLWRQVVFDAIDGSIQGDATDEQDGENNVREGSREIYHLRTHSASARLLSGASLEENLKKRVVKTLQRARVQARGEYLAGGLDTPEETEENNNPGDCQAAQDGQMHFSKVPNIVRDVQHIVPKMINHSL